FALLSFSCQNAQTSQTQTTANQEPVSARTPSDAFKSLYAAVKAKDNAKIQQLMSSNTLTFAGFAIEQQKQSLEKVLENGLTATTFASSLPEIRDERVNGNFGAVEVFSQKDNRWEDLPFVLEDGSWKLAVGDSFKGTYKSPGKGQAQIEMETNNPMGGDMIPSETNTNGKFPRVKNGDVETVEVPFKNSNKAPAKANKK
ncbi:MAG TPA: hypothetical protein VNI60_05040, partial [Pyrinomonadaceae bacterium]|nr:hypothetical protein [Pyrinomonadaceae bacterium]